MLKSYTVLKWEAIRTTNIFSGVLAVAYTGQELASKRVSTTSSEHVNSSSYRGMRSCNSSGQTLN